MDDDERTADLEKQQPQQPTPTTQQAGENTTTLAIIDCSNAAINENESSKPAAEPKIESEIEEPSTDFLVSSSSSNQKMTDSNNNNETKDQQKKSRNSTTTSMVRRRPLRNSLSTSDGSKQRQARENWKQQQSSQKSNNNQEIQQQKECSNGASLISDDEKAVGESPLSLAQVEQVEPTEPSGSGEGWVGAKHVNGQDDGMSRVASSSSNIMGMGPGQTHEGPKSDTDEEQQALEEGMPQGDDVSEDHHSRGWTTAHPVDENQDPALFLPSAVPHDPAETKIVARDRKRKRLRRYAIMGCTMLLLVIVVVVPVVLTVKRGNNNQNLIVDPPTDSPTNMPTAAPTSIREFEIRNRIQREVGLNSTENTPQDIALDWIINKDPMQLAADDNNLVQRYVLALFYQQTTNMGTMQWRSCNPPPAEGEGQNCTYQDFLFRMDNGTDVFRSVSRIRWFSGNHECEWAGVSCPNAAKQVQRIDLAGQKLSGSIPTELRLLPLLREVYLQFNSITGGLPEEFATIPSLFYLNLESNLLSGTIPEAFFHSSKLFDFNIAANPLMGGTLSASIGNWSSLATFDISGCSFSGTIPTEIGALLGLFKLRIQQNAFTGTIPTEFSRLSNLQEMNMHSNRLEGMPTIPIQFSYLPALAIVDLQANNFTGTIPEELYDIEDLHSLFLNDNSFTGTLSTKIGQLSQLWDLGLSANPLTGTIPTEVANIPSLRLAWFHLTLLTGSVPQQICNQRTNVGGPLQQLLADCLPTENPIQQCDCCTACCDRVGTRVCEFND